MARIDLAFIRPMTEFATHRILESSWYFRPNPSATMAAARMKPVEQDPLQQPIGLIRREPDQRTETRQSPPKRAGPADKALASQTTARGPLSWRSPRERSHLYILRLYSARRCCTFNEGIRGGSYGKQSRAPAPKKKSPAVNQRLLKELQKYLANSPAEILGHIEAPAYCCSDGTVALVKIDRGRSGPGSLSA